MIFVEAYKISGDMFYSKLEVLQKLKSLLALSSSTSRVKGKSKVFLSFLGYIVLVIICLNLHFEVVIFLNLVLEGAKSNPAPRRFTFHLDYSHSVFE